MNHTSPLSRSPTNIIEARRVEDDLINKADAVKELYETWYGVAQNLHAQYAKMSLIDSEARTIWSKYLEAYEKSEKAYSRLNCILNECFNQTVVSISRNEEK